ncbi:MAG: thiamine phosphate synthase [Salibacteraceae bacterium]
MELIIISSPNKGKSEIRHIVEFFENGLNIYHIKKKDFSYSKMEEFICMIPQKYHDRLVLHSHYYLAKKYKLRGIHISRHKKRRKYLSTVHYYFSRLFVPRLKISKSFHSIHSMILDKKKYDYVFLSPVFDHHDISIFSAAFGEKQLRSVLYKSKHNVVALGGVKLDRIELARRTGFFGVALHSAIWKEKTDRIGGYKLIKNELDRVVKEIN